MHNLNSLNDSDVRNLTQLLKQHKQQQSAHAFFYKPLLKLCGFKQVEDAMFAASLGVHAIGLVFYNKSARYVSPKIASQIVAQVKKVNPNTLMVGLFVNHSAQAIFDICTEVNLDILQFHGDETSEFCEKIAKVQQKPYWRALGITNQAFSKNTYQTLQQHHPNADAFLLDVKSVNYGGTGQSFDWKIVDSTLWQASQPALILSGGLNLDNIMQACLLKPCMLDLSSGIESAKGIKDMYKIQQLMEVLGYC